MNTNIVVLTGNLTRGVELKQVGEYQVAKFAIAVNDRVKKNGEWTEVANFFEVETWNGAEACAKYLSKGSSALVRGALVQHRWETDEGQKRSKVYVKAQHVEFIGGKGEAGEKTTQADTMSPLMKKATAVFDAKPDADDDIPF